MFKFLNAVTTLLFFTMAVIQLSIFVAYIRYL